MNISVIICTYNRAKSLERTLRSLQAQHVNSNVSWEVIVVDNNCTDGTPEVVAEFTRICDFPVRYLLEKRQGKSFALNAGIAASRGEILALTDDDVVAQSNWLEAMWKAATTYKVGGFGGKILPLWTFRKPDWIVMDGPFRNAFGKVGVHDFGDEVRDYGTTGLLSPAGANMFFRSNIFAEHRGFDERFGLFGHNRIGQVDTEFCRRLMDKGESLLYIPDVVVWHVQEKARASKRYFRSWHVRHGRTDVMRERVRLQAVRYFGVPRYLLTKIALEALRWASYMVTMRPIAAFLFELRAIHCLGRAAGYFDRWRKNQGKHAAAAAHAARRAT